MPDWIPTHQPPHIGDRLPPERKTVLVWLETQSLPFCGYIRYHSGGSTRSGCGVSLRRWRSAYLRR